MSALRLSSFRKLLVSALCLFAGQLGAAEITVLAPNAVRASVAKIAARYQQASGNQVVFSWTGTESITKRISEGETFDVVLNAGQNIDRLIREGKLVAGSRTDFAKSAIGVAIRAGLERPDVATVDGLRRALLKADSIAISSGTSGRYLADLFERLGISGQIKDKVRQPKSGAQIGDLLASGEAELGFQQVSELLHASGIQFLGPLPAAIQNYTTYSAGLHSSAAQPAVAADFMKTLVTPDAAALVRATGMEPM